MLSTTVPITTTHIPLPTPDHTPPSGRPRLRTHRRVSHRITTAVSVATPAVRTLVVTASSDDGETSFELMPVVLLESRAIREYSALAEIGRVIPTAPDHAGMLKHGWTYEGETVVRDAVVIDPEMGVMPAEELLGDVTNLSFRIVAAPWDPSEDETRLAGVIAAVREAAVEQEATWRRRSGQGSPNPPSRSARSQDGRPCREGHPARPHAGRTPE